MTPSTATVNHIQRGYVDMVGDLFHYGHVEQLQKIKESGYEVVVGVHSDEVVASYKRQPILTMEERIRVIRSCRYVDEVIPNAPLIVTMEYLKQHHLDMVFHGHSLEEDEQYRIMYGEINRLGHFTRTDYTVGISTTHIIRRIEQRYCDEQLGKNKK